MLELNGLFNESYYLAQNPDVEMAIARGFFGSGLRHFTEYGQFERRNPSAFFDTEYYLRQNTDVATAVENGAHAPVEHFLRFGQLEGRSPNPFFNNTYYLQRNPDVADVVRRTAGTRDALTGIEHFIENGQFEGRNPSANFNNASYLQQNAEVADLVRRSTGTTDPITGIEHYLTYGKDEGRRGGNVGNVIFIHPDGTSPSHYAATRFLTRGPDGRLNWDMMESAGVYLGHMGDQLTGTSNAGAVTHATGVKVQASSFGLDEAGRPVVALSGRQQTILEEAIAAGKATAAINSGIVAEPGTGAFLAKASGRGDTAEITAQMVRSGVSMILGGGEVDYLPNTVTGRFGFSGRRTDGVNLIDEARNRGYTVVYNLDELRRVQPGEKVIGIFAAFDTYNDQVRNAAGQRTASGSEEDLARAGLPLYGQPPLNPNPPTVGNMLEQALRILSPDPNGFFIVLEEEGTDNFGNNNNAAGTLEAGRRADEAIGLAMGYIQQNPNTLLVTAADSDAGGLEVIDRRGQPNAPVGANIDGRTGTNTLPFISAPAANGQTYPFGIRWVDTPDFPGSIVGKAHGLNSRLLPSTIDNTDIYKLMYETLFGVRLPGITGF